MPKEINLTQGMKALVDDEDYEELSRYKWTAVICSGKPYAARMTSLREGARKTVFMHRQVMGLLNGSPLFVDHINGKGLDNRRTNLRTANRYQNGQNQILSKANKTGFKGVSWNKETRRFVARIRANNVCYHLGVFTEPEPAYAAYCEAAVKLHGNFARTK